MTNPSRNSFIMIATFFITAIMNYVYNVSMGWFLTPEQFGVLGVSISFLLILSLFVTSAFPLTSTKFISGEYEEKLKHRVFKSSLVSNILIGLVLSAIFYMGYTTHVFELGEGYDQLVLGIVVTTILTSAMVVYISILQGTFRFKLLGIITAIITIGKLVFGVLLVKAGFGAFGALLGIPISCLIGIGLAILFTRDFTFWKTGGWADTHVYLFALPMFFGTLGMTLLMNIDILGVKFLTDSLLSNTLAGYYRASLILAQFPVFLTGAMMGVLFPYISKHEGNEAYSLKSIKYATLFILPASIIVASLPGSLITLIFPDVYLAAAPSLRIIAIGMGCLAMIMVFTHIFQARHAPRIPAVVLPCAVIVEILLLIALVPEYGIIGAAASTTIACAIGLLALLVLYIQYYKFKTDYAALVKTIVSLSIFTISLILLPHTGLLWILADLTISGLIYLLSLTFLNLLGEEDLAIIISGLPDHRFINFIAENILHITRKLNENGL
ncbi:MAG: oligosaccharide flippase family protein [Methanosarcinaceae archaeon]|nr:oligosaccharide flippase family protein [Methanosarcinaceae archaeon]